MYKAPACHNVVEEGVQQYRTAIVEEGKEFHCTFSFPLKCRFARKKDTKSVTTDYTY